jgi:RNA polymerase sigma factor (TIGR02999 family)
MAPYSPPRLYCQRFLSFLRQWSRSREAILRIRESGDPSAAEQLLPLVYEELRNLAAAKMASEDRSIEDWFPNDRLAGNLLQLESVGGTNIELMTTMIRKIRQVTEEEGLSRGRPILLAVRIPEDEPLSLSVGLDVRTWLEQGLVDLLAVGRWQEFTIPVSAISDLAHQHHVPVYPLVNSFYKGKDYRYPSDANLFSDPSVYLRLVDVDKVQHWNGRGHFFGAAAEAMRRILVNRARDKGRLKRGGQWHKIDLEKIEVALDAPHEELLALDESIERLAVENPECASVVKLRFFAGLTIDDAAAAMGISASTAKRHWAYARAWLFDALRADDQST